MIKKNIFNKFGFKSSFVQNYLLFFSVLFIFILIFSLLYNYNSQKVMQREFIQNASNDADNMASALDLVLEETEMIAHYMSVDPTVITYMMYGEKTPIGDIKEKLKGVVNPYHFIYEYIHSIYVYSEDSRNIYSGDNFIPFEKFGDDGWMDEYNNGSPLTVFPRAYADNYPMLLSIIRKPDSPLINGGIIINVKLSTLLEFAGKSNPNQEKLIIGKNGNVIYRSNTQAVLENAENCINNSLSNHSQILKLGGETYIIGISPSRYPDFKYVVINKITDYSNRMKELTKYTILLVFIFLAASMIIGYIYSTITYKPIDSIVKLVTSPEARNKHHNYKSSETQFIANAIIREIELNDDLKKCVEQQMNRIASLKLYALGMQINPHFINNTINVVHLKLLYEIGIKYPGNEMMSALSKLMQYVLKEKSDMVTLETELHYTKYFIDILSTRNNGDINISVNVADDVSPNAKILKLCTHTILENSFYHGISPRPNQSGNIKTDITRTDSALIITISDDGIGMTAEQLNDLNFKLDNCDSFENSNIGLLNIHQRIKLIFGDEYGLKVYSEADKGTTVTMTMPYII